MKKGYQIISERNNEREVLETCSSREEAEYALAHYLTFPSAKDFILYILEVGAYASI